ncbi:hypothetical protein ACFWMJ_22040 [Streptomyces hawaiiensis]|uniref:hypothetical protein n=1 Tax=Streptomyces hawaiiensis TaxID=67305 RepID=UPI0036534AAE
MLAAASGLEQRALAARLVDEERPVLARVVRPVLLEEFGDPGLGLVVVGLLLQQGDQLGVVVEDLAALLVAREAEDLGAAEEVLRVEGGDTDRHGALPRAAQKFRATGGRAPPGRPLAGPSMVGAGVKCVERWGL